MSGECHRYILSLHILCVLPAHLPFHLFSSSPLSYLTHPLLSSSFIYLLSTFPICALLSFPLLLLHSSSLLLSCLHIASASFCPRLSKESFDNRMLLHNSDHYANVSFIQSIQKKPNFLFQGQNKSPLGNMHEKGKTHH